MGVFLVNCVKKIKMSVWNNINQGETEKYLAAEKLNMLSNIEHSPLKSHFLSQNAASDENTIRPNEIERQTVKQLMPILQQGFVEMIGAARKEKTFQRKYHRFDPVDFLSNYLYNSNRAPNEQLDLLDIPFVKSCLAENPRKELPLRQRLTDDEAVLIIQKGFRAYRARKASEIQELRVWQANHRNQETRYYSGDTIYSEPNEQK